MAAAVETTGLCDQSNGANEGDGSIKCAPVQDGPQTSAKRKRSRTGCLVCRKDKKRCDERHPTCVRCERLRSECIWPNVSDPKRPASKKQAQSVQQVQAFPQNFTMHTTRSPVAPPPPASLPVRPEGSSALGPYSNDTASSSSYVNGAVQAGGFPSPASSSAISATLPSVPAESSRIIGYTDASIQSSASAEASHTSSLPFWPAELDSTAATLGEDYSFLLNATGEHDIMQQVASTNGWDGLYLYDLAAPVTRDFAQFLASLQSVDNAADSSQHSNIAATLPEPPLERVANQPDPEIASDPTLSVRRRLNALTASLPRKVSAVVQKILDEQDRGNCDVPLPWLLNAAMWLPARALQDLIDQVKLIYNRKPALRGVIDNFTSTASATSASDFRRSIQPTVTVAEICSMPGLSLEHRTHAMMDLSFKYFFDSGAAAYYSALDEVGRFLCQTLHSGRLLNLAALSSIEMFGITNFAWADICRSLALKQPTLFHYIFEPTANGDQHLLMGTQYSNGSSDVISCLIADISTFRFAIDRDVRSRPSPGVISPIYQARADEIKRALLNFSPSILKGSETEYEGDSFANVGDIAVQELWRQVAIVHFYQSIYRYPSAHETLQSAMKQIIGLFNVIEISNPIRLDAMLSLPIFLAASVAITEDDRKTCMMRMRKLGEVGGQALAHQQNRAIIERVWDVSDSTGNSVSWQDYASETSGPAFM